MWHTRAELANILHSKMSVFTIVKKNSLPNEDSDYCVIIEIEVIKMGFKNNTTRRDKCDHLN